MNRFHDDILKNVLFRNQNCEDAEKKQ